MKRIIFAVSLALSSVASAFACSTDFTINLETFGAGVSVELRRGAPGSSKLIKTQQSSGGTVYFSGLCAGSYFLAIGDSEQVNVTPVRQFEDYMQYTSSIRMQKGSGNVTKKSRSAL
jgi:hypothetical protein